jgi:branched-chain amino acid transport system ATP-binding protein
MPPLLLLDGVFAAYGDLVAIRDVSLEVHAGELVALIGSNGAGKTTTLRAICGLVERRGRVELDGARIDGLGSAEIVARGIAHVPEGRQLFPSMTVRENLELGARTPESRRQRTATLERVYALFPRLAERRSQLAGTLSGGEQQMTAIGRALMACPRILMLDEPSLGLAPVVVSAIFENLVAINRDGTTVLLVEQNVLRALRVCTRAYVLDNGTVTLVGTPDMLLADEGVKRAYLG